LNFQYVNELSFLIHSIYEKYIGKPSFFYELKTGFEPVYHDFADRDLTNQTFEHFIL